ncbi:DUF924 family protein [Comamonas composti]|uniref:DUF924 family protein n=1 Tax=Comamonas composti TaxID=408558 RepID=UPI00047AC985|nr:DUF924 family protein [Comamonas composti]
MTERQSFANAPDMQLDQILEYWFGSAQPEDTQALERKTLWFTKSEATDREMRERFGPWVERALAGELDAWAATPRGRLGLLLLLDQFTRNIYRATPRSFAGDARALALALEGMALGHDRQLPLVTRIFCYLPLEHAEDLSLQERSVAAFAALAEQATPETRDFLEGTLDYAHKHREVIADYGRFPHRNAILGRESTAKEKEYLAQPGAGF